MMPALFICEVTKTVLIHTVRQRLYRLFFDQRTRAGRRVEAMCGALALFSVFAVFIESALGTQYHPNDRQWQLFVFLELGFTLIFTFEYLLRVFCWPSPAKYVFSFWGFIDLATLLPLYVLWLWPEIGVNYVFAWRAMRAICVLRILKLLRYMPSLNALWQSIIQARHQLILFYAFILIVMVVAGGLMYGIEGPTNGFTTLGTSVYWAVVTVTTVGYGDITPHTGAGRMVASILILIGYSVIAIPTGIITAHMTTEFHKQRSARECPKCRRGNHDAEAHYCKVCGCELPKL